MRGTKCAGIWAWKLAAIMAILVICGRTSLAEVTVIETPTRVVVENESVRLVFDPTVNYVPTELVYKRGSGKNLIVDSFCLYYQYIESGAISSVNEGTNGRISNDQYLLERKDGGATVEFHCDTPHFHMTRWVTVPTIGPAVKFAYELECKKADSFVFYLPYAPLSPSLHKSATSIEFIGKDGEKAGRIRVEDVKSPTLNTSSPYNRAACYFNSETGEGIVFAHVQEECDGGISERHTPRFDVGMKERCTFVVVPFQGDYEKAFASYLKSKKDAKPDPWNASSAIILKRTPEWVLWSDHSTRKVFPEEVVSTTSPLSEGVVIEAAKCLEQGSATLRLPQDRKNTCEIHS
jgi:hypothetical protein